MKKALIVSNIQRACLHDGPGLRTTIFLKSCLLKCPWCANPEASFYKNKYIVNNNCELINNRCAYGIDCLGQSSSLKLLEKNYMICPVSAIERLYRDYSIEELNNIIIDDSFLFGDDGGVTFSGGEPLLQSSNLLELLKLLKQQNINITIETCLYASQKNLEELLDYVDLFIIDIKILNSDQALNFINGDLQLFLKNVELVFQKNKNVIFRIPLIKPYITDNNNLDKIYKFLNKYRPLKVEIFKGHNLAKEKYQKLNLKYFEVETICDDEIIQIKNKINEFNIPVDIISF